MLVFADLNLSCPINVVPKVGLGYQSCVYRSECAIRDEVSIKICLYIAQLNSADGNGLPTARLTKFVFKTDFPFVVLLPSSRFGAFGPSILY